MCTRNWEHTNHGTLTFCWGIACLTVPFTTQMYITAAGYATMPEGTDGAKTSGDNSVVLLVPKAGWLLTGLYSMTCGCA